MLSAKMDPLYRQVATLMTLWTAADLKERFWKAKNWFPTNRLHCSVTMTPMSIIITFSKWIKIPTNTALPP